MRTFIRRWMRPGGEEVLVTLLGSTLLLCELIQKNISSNETGITVLLAGCLWHENRRSQRPSHWSLSLEQLLFLSPEPTGVACLGCERRGLVAAALGKSGHTLIAPFFKRSEYVGMGKGGEKDSSNNGGFTQHKLSSTVTFAAQFSYFQLQANVKKITCSQCQQELLIMKMVNCEQNIYSNYPIRG